MTFLGFSGGLPFLLVFSTLTAWLTEGNVSRSTIGFFAWIGITYSTKVLWAPVVDSIPIPILTKKLGQRRSWMLIGQMGIALGLVLMSLIGPSDLLILSCCAFLVAFSSATQDVAIDAFRIESAEPEYQGAMSAAYVFGYRLALLIAGAGALYLAEYFSWTIAYITMATLMLIGVITVILVAEPDRQSESFQLELSPIGLRRWFTGAVAGPFVDFFSRNGKVAFIILLFIAVFRLSDIAMGIMANPFYLDMGYTKIEIANVAKVFGFFMSIAGSLICGVLVVKWGLMRPLFIGAVAVSVTNLLFASLSILEPKVSYLAIVISADNISGGFAATAFIAYLSSLTNRAYTATQYALFSSLMTLPGKFISGFSGLVVENFGYFEFFVVAAMLGLPAILLVVWLSRYERSQLASQP
ncbi:MAG: AmpG family muropeptide MFS transporter [Gammaproteobacteria bacterium]|nr:AmpG family muropeptide MFS transporter [Gammaproteobacteria bacterium]MBT5153234.1 AmpG family muropeptide MFS transporter [Gammaproteobacteria bacterium]